MPTQISMPMSQFGSQLANVAQRFGLFDVLVPFLLVFSVMYAVLHPRYKKDDKGQPTKELHGILGTRNSVAVAVSAVIALMFLLPHFMGSSPDPVALINAAIPNISVIGIAILMGLILLGILGVGGIKGYLQVIAVLLSLFGVIYIFLLGAGYTPFQWLTQTFPILLDQQVQDLIIILLVFGIIVYFVISEPETEPTNLSADDLKKWKEERRLKAFMERLTLRDNK